MTLSLKLIEETNRFLNDLTALAPSNRAFAVYNPLEYAREPYIDYLKKYGNSKKDVFFLGMNPGPWGMAQTGIPFGEITTVKEWLRIEGTILTPDIQHPKRPVTGWETTRSEVSGRRLWNLFKERFSTPENFFETGFVGNYCPLVFMEESGRNLTPDKLPKEEKESLFRICDLHLKNMVDILSPRYLIGIGKFAEKRLNAVFRDCGKYKIASIIHPSPANPAANRDWNGAVSAKLSELGIWD